VSTAAVSARWYPPFKLGIFLLLTANAGIFAAHGSWGEGVDSISWLVLLLLFELETAHSERLRGPRAIATVRTTRLVAAAAVLVAAIGYLHATDWLDAANAWLWIAVVILLEIEVRSSLHEASRRRLFGTTAAVLYLGLLGMVIAWVANGEWFDAYDAALWLIAFATIEMNVLAMPGRV
jgi:hypothetical protein